METTGMETIQILLAATGALAIFALLSLAFGAESRDGFAG
jgi:hypothetical protein